jgi:hypothetical protein
MALLVVIATRHGEVALPRHPYRVPRSLSWRLLLLLFALRCWFVCVDAEANANVLLLSVESLARPFTGG